MKWLVTGADGMLGGDLVRALEERGEEVSGTTIDTLDITDSGAVGQRVSTIAPAVIVNCAAYTNVDGCETSEELATKINGWAVETLADAANRVDALLVQISTDFVFDGSATSPYEINQAAAPISAYGRSKLEGEERARLASRHLVLRTSWLFGFGGWNFVEAIRKQVLAGCSELRVVTDQRGCPTYTPHLAQAIIRLGERIVASPELGGIYHYSDSPDCTWFEFAAAIVDEMKREGTASAEVAVLPTTSADFVRPAQRPAYSVLSTERYQRVTGCAPESWRDGLEDYIARTSGR